MAWFVTVEAQLFLNLLVLLIVPLSSCVQFYSVSLFVVTGAVFTPLFSVPFISIRFPRGVVSMLLSLELIQPVVDPDCIFNHCDYISRLTFYPSKLFVNMSL